MQNNPNRKIKPENQTGNPHTTVLTIVAWWIIADNPRSTAVLSLPTLVAMAVVIALCVKARGVVLARIGAAVVMVVLHNKQTHVTLYNMRQACRRQ